MRYDYTGNPWSRFRWSNNLVGFIHTHWKPYQQSQNPVLSWQQQNFHNVPVLYCHCIFCIFTLDKSKCEINFFFNLYRCSVYVLYRILYETIWKRCRFVFAFTSMYEDVKNEKLFCCGNSSGTNLLRIAGNSKEKLAFTFVFSQCKRTFCEQWHHKVPSLGSSFPYFCSHLQYITIATRVLVVLCVWTCRDRQDVLVRHQEIYSIDENSHLI